MLDLRPATDTDPPPEATVDLTGPALARWGEAQCDDARDPETRAAREQE